MILFVFVWQDTLVAPFWCVLFFVFAAKGSLFFHPCGEAFVDSYCIVAKASSVLLFSDESQPCKLMRDF